MKNNRDKDNAPDLGLGAAGSKIDAIKEIIFGQNIQEYEQQFALIRDEINSLDDKSVKNMSELEKQIMSRIDSMEKALTKQMDSNHKQLLKEVEQLTERKTDRKELGKMLINIGTKLSS